MSIGAGWAENSWIKESWELEAWARYVYPINILDLNLTIPKADEDPAEQQRILIENITLIQQALRNLGQ